MVLLKLLFTFALLLTLMIPYQGHSMGYAELKVNSGLEPLDETPLLGRIPLVLVHGINPNPKVQYGWAGFLNYLERKTAFHDRYKLYLFVFNAQAPVSQSSERLTLALREFLNDKKPEKPFRIAALSLGGLLVQNAMHDPEVERHTDRIVGLGVPFHGTPLANPSWVRAQLATQSIFSPLRLSNRLVFKLTKQRFPAFESDFCWDNFDGSMPPIFMAQAVSCPSRSRLGHEKYLLYAGFFGARSEESSWLRQLVQAVNPMAVLQEKRAFWGKHGLFPFARSSIAKLPLANNTQDKINEASLYPPMMVFNDGISPISSQLWLGRFIDDSKPKSPETLWQAVTRFKGTEKARLFEGLDHRDWLEGGSRLKNVDRLQDLLHPEQPERNIFEWLEYDLMRE